MGHLLPHDARFGFQGSAKHSPKDTRGRLIRTNGCNPRTSGPWRPSGCRFGALFENTGKPTTPATIHCLGITRAHRITLEVEGMAGAYGMRGMREYAKG